MPPEIKPMKGRLVKVNNLSGGCATIYSFLPDGEQKTLFDVFLEEYRSSFKNEITEIVGRLRTFGKQTGARESFFTMDEGRYGDGCCALHTKPKGKLRLYCLRFGTEIVVLAGGSPKDVKAWQDDPKLKAEMERLMRLAEELNRRLEEKEVTYTANYLVFKGDLTFDI